MLAWAGGLVAWLILAAAQNFLFLTAKICAYGAGGGDVLEFETSPYAPRGAPVTLDCPRESTLVVAIGSRLLIEVQSLASQATAAALAIPAHVTLWPMSLFVGEAVPPGALKQDREGRVRALAEMCSLRRASWAVIPT